MEERVVNVPLLGGINEDDDIFSVEPPEMAELVNVQAIRKGALDTRQGFNLVTRSASIIEPATAFRDTSGTTQSVNDKVEAIGTYAGATGIRPVLASGGKFYEYVGADADRGFREVNDLSEYVGTLSSVSSTGGSIIEIESLLFDNETKRMTVWISGLRTGQELSSDRSMIDQVQGDGNAVYYSIQEVESEAYLVPPTRLRNAAGAQTTSAINLRLVAMYGSSGTRRETMAFWFNYQTVEVECCLFDLTTGAAKPTTTLPRAVTINARTHRCFDVVALDQSGAGPYYTFMYALCEADTGSSVNWAKVEARIATVNGTTGVVTSALPVTDILAHPIVAGNFTPWAVRGVVLEQQPEMTQAGADWTATVSVAIRVVSRFRSAEGWTAKLDGQMALGRLIASRTGGVYAMAVRGYKYLPLIGFQTNDDLSQVLSVTSAPRRFSGSPRTTRALTTSYTVAALPTPPVAGGTLGLGRNSEWTVALQLDDGAPQVYFCSIETPFIVNQSPYYTLTPRSSQPFDAANASGLNGPNNCYSQIRQGWVPTPHLYVGDQDLPFDQPAPTLQQGRQINLIDIDAATVNTGFTDGYYNTVNVLDGPGGNIIATASVVVSGGSIVSVAIINPLAGVPGGYAFPVGVPSLAGIQFDASIGAGTLTGAKAWNLTQSLVTEPAGADQPSRASGTPAGNVSFYFTGQQEHCVQRWSVAHTGASDLLVLSSCSATPVTNPQGDAPFGAASPMRFNNFCEFWRYTSAVVPEYVSLVPLAGGSVVKSPLCCAAGGPWRLVGGLTKDNGKFYAAICPAGDDSQASTFLVRLTVTDEVSIVWPAGSSLEPIPTASGVTYINNKGFFVEAANMMRVTAPPLNVPALHVTNAGLTMGALRNGSSKGSQECFALDYEYVPQNYRTLLRMSDYTFINGGVLSMFDGVNCNEAGIFIWPQRDLTSISWGDGTNQWTQSYTANDPTYLPFQQFEQPAGGGIKPTFRALYNISRPYWFYEAGLNLRGNVFISLRTGYESVTTKWGGDPSANYESIYADGRVQQFSSFTKPGYSGGADFYGAHYYGRFQAAGTDYSNDSAYATPLKPFGNSAYSYFLWAPRSAKGWSYPDDGTVKGNAESAYSQAEAGGDFLLSWCYEYADGTGRMVRSAPSSPTQYTVCAEIFSSDPNAKRTDGKRRIGGAVTRFKWGFLAPRLELTNRLSSASEDPRRVLLQPYSTCEPYATVMYRMPWKNFQNGIGDFVVPRNATRGVVPYATEPYDTASDNPCGYVVTNINRPPTSPTARDGSNALFDGPTGDYMGMLREPYLYTTGGVLDNVATPGCRAMCVHQNRLVIGGADDPTVVWFSKELTPTDSIGFNDQLTLTIEAGGAVTGLASMNSSLFVFKKHDVYVISGSLPDATGNSSSMSEPVRLPSGIGCVDHRSVISTPLGIFFRSARSMELLTPDLQIRPVGDKVIDLINQYPHVTATAQNAATEEIFFVCQDGLMGRAGVSVNSILLVYSYKINAWYRWDIQQFGRGQASVTVVGSAPWLALRDPDGSSQAFVYQQIPGQYVDGLLGLLPVAYNYTHITVNWRTAPFALNQVQGFQRVKRCRLLAYRADGTTFPGLAFGLFTDASASQVSSWTATEVTSVVSKQNLVQLETHVANQKGQLLALQCQTVAPAVVDTNAANVRFSNIALVVGLKQGLNKRITEEAKH